MVEVDKCVSATDSFFDQVINEDWDAATKTRTFISESEKEADKLKADIRNNLPKSLFLPVARSDILEMLHSQDKIANCAKDLTGVIIGRRMQIPAPLQAKFKAFVAVSVESVNETRKAIDELGDLLESGFRGRELAIVDKIVDRIHQLEDDADALQRDLRYELFEIEKDLPPVDVIFLYRTIESVGDLSDRAQSVGSRLQILTAR
jgi:predicted phosphate transport protein (TIGR00153 family)